MRKVSIMGMLVAANFATAGLGQYIDGENGKLAISNITPVLFLAFAIPSFLLMRRTIPKTLIAFLLAFNAFASLSFVIFAFKYGWAPNFPVLFFQDVEVLFVLLLVWYGQNHLEEFRAVARWGTICSVAISVWYGLQQIKIAGALYLLFGMDDKSQAAILFCCQAFVMIRYFGRPLDLAVAGLLMLMSMFSLSRLPVFFVPVIFVALAKRSTIAATFSAVAAGGAGAAVLSSGIDLAKVFRIIERLSSLQAVASDSATSAHLLLIKSALQLKFTDAYSFVFGTGPGNFAKALTSSSISKVELQAADPLLVTMARVNRAPMHSTPLSALLDYSLPVFFILAFLLAKSFRYLALFRHYIDLMFFVTLLAASMFYSVHNKPYVFLLCAASVIMLKGSNVTAQGMPVPRLPGDRVDSPS